MFFATNIHKKMNQLRKYLYLVSPTNDSLSNRIFIYISLFDLQFHVFLFWFNLSFLFEPVFFFNFKI